MVSFCDGCGGRLDARGTCACGTDGATVALRQDALAQVPAPASTSARIDLASRVAHRRARATMITASIALVAVLGLVWLTWANVTAVPTRASGATTSAGGTRAVDAGSVSSTSESADPSSSLQDRRDEDRRALTGVEGSWLPQVSSKRVGLVADGITYDEAAIWKQFQTTLATHPSARLVSSSDWGSFQQGRYWVTLIDERFTTAAQANAWCDSEGYPTDQCYAKRLSSNGSFAGNTVTRN